MLCRILATGFVAVVVSLTVTPAQAEDPAIDAVVEILKARGVIDEAEATRIVSLNRSYEERKQEAWYDRITFYGDFRGRYEAFWFDDDKLGNNAYNRHRLRYRVRLGAKTQINEYIGLDFRLATSEGQANTTRNQTLGRGRNYDPDGFYVDYAYLDIRPFKNLAETIPGGSFRAQFGKVKNPFMWKKFKDWLLWDADITPEGVALLFQAEPTGSVDLFANAGYFIFEENSSTSDPHMFGLQVGGEVSASDSVAVGGRASWYAFHSLDSGTLADFTAGGNVADAMTSSRTGRGGLDVGELAAYLAYSGFEDWPITVFGDIARNFDATRSQLFPTIDGGEDTAWGVGVELGDKNKYVSLGLGFWHVEANAFPTQFLESDMMDGLTNREGWAFWGKRRLLPNTEASFTLFFGTDAIDDDLPGLLPSLVGAERVRLQTNVEVFF
jgi:hypothetical protein